MKPMFKEGMQVSYQLSGKPRFGEVVDEERRGRTSGVIAVLIEDFVDKQCRRIPVSAVAS